MLTNQALQLLLPYVQNNNTLTLPSRSGQRSLDFALDDQNNADRLKNNYESVPRFTRFHFPDMEGSFFLDKSGSTTIIGTYDDDNLWFLNDNDPGLSYWGSWHSMSALKAHGFYALSSDADDFNFVPDVLQNAFQMILDKEASHLSDPVSTAHTNDTRSLMLILTQTVLMAKPEILAAFNRKDLPCDVKKLMTELKIAVPAQMLNITLYEITHPLLKNIQQYIVEQRKNLLVSPEKSAYDNLLLSLQKVDPYFDKLSGSQQTNVVGQFVNSLYALSMGNQVSYVVANTKSDSFSLLLKNNADKLAKFSISTSGVSFLPKTLPSIEELAHNMLHLPEAPVTTGNVLAKRRTFTLHP